jgi:4-hydroxybenzoate polyprenyltransferase
MGAAATGGLTFRVALRLGRVSNLPTVWTNVAAGTILAGAAGFGALPLLVVALSLFYIAGMFLNDAFDAEFDRRFRPERPIPAGEVSATTVLVSGLAMLVLGWLLLIGGAMQAAVPGAAHGAAIAGLLLALAILLYDWRHKANPLSPLVMGLCRVLAYFASGLAAAAALPPALLGGAAILLCYLIGLTYAAKQENLRRITNLWPLAFLAAPFLYALPIAAGGIVGALLYLGFLGWVLYALSFLLLPQRLNIGRAIVALIAGISLLDALLIAGAGANGIAILCLAGFLATLGLQRWIAGT